MSAQTIEPRFFNERFIIKAMVDLNSAQSTFQATAGNGSFGSLSSLHNEALIGGALASGQRSGYSFVVQFIPPSAGTPSTYTVTATPVLYRKTGRRSFFVDQTGILRGADKSGGFAGNTDPEIDPCALFGGLAETEKCVIQDLRTIYAAEATYASTFGNGNYGSISDLYAASLIRSYLVDYFSRGYAFQLQTRDRNTTTPASFKLTSIPISYGTSGIRSFYIDTTGVIRGADKQGQAANENDPPIDE